MGHGSRVQFCRRGFRIIFPFIQPALHFSPPFLFLYSPLLPSSGLFLVMGGVFMVRVPAGSFPPLSLFLVAPSWLLTARFSRAGTPTFPILLFY